MLPRNIEWSNQDQVRHAKQVAKDTIKSIIGSNVEALWKSIQQGVREEGERMAAEAKEFGSAIPVVFMQDILDKKVSAATIARIHKRGTAVIKAVYSPKQMDAWNNELIHYIEDNKYNQQDISPDLDQYFSGLKSKKPQIFNVYWSKAQMEIRQHPNMAQVKSFLNHLWKFENSDHQYFNPDQECIYADRLRMRAPGDTSLGLSPHIDGGSVERWIDDANRKIYEPIFNGAWKKYQPFDGAYRNEVENIPSPAVCRAFRTYQGWVSLTQQGAGDGTLQLVPMVKESTAFLLIRPFLDDIDAHTLCGAEPSRAQAIDKNWHQELIDNLVTIPHMDPGDTVWWHHDLIHAVEDEHSGKNPSSVTYIGAAPYCKRNHDYLKLQQTSFLDGLSPPDFAPENREKKYRGRCHFDDLSALGKKQMGFSSW